MESRGHIVSYYAPQIQISTILVRGYEVNQESTKYGKRAFPFVRRGLVEETLTVIRYCSGVILRMYGHIKFKCICVDFCWMVVLRRFVN